MANWTFITNHGAVLSLIGKHGQITARELSRAIGITERSVQRIIAELELAGYIEKHKEGRRNVYLIRADLPLRHITQRDRLVRDLLQALKANQETVLETTPIIQEN